MAFYYDSSLMLSFLLEEEHAIDASAAWDDVSLRLSSGLLKIECIIGIRRSGILQQLKPDSEWVKERIDLLDRYFAAMHFKTIDDSIEIIIRDHPAISRCRSLDAIHLATALYLKPNLDEPLYMASLDTRLREAAKALDLELFPRSG